MGSIRRTPAGTWQAYWRSPAGRQESKTFRTKRDASAFLAQMKTSAVTGSYVSPHAGRTPFGEHTRLWMASWNTEATTSARDESIMRVHVLRQWGVVAAGQDRPPGHPDLDHRAEPAVVARDRR